MLVLRHTSIWSSCVLREISFGVDVFPQHPMGGSSALQPVLLVIQENLSHIATCKW